MIWWVLLPLLVLLAAALLSDRLVFDSWGRVAFDFANYEPLRQSGFSHRDAVAELDRMWEDELVMN